MKKDNSSKREKLMLYASPFIATLIGSTTLSRFSDLVPAWSSNTIALFASACIAQILTFYILGRAYIRKKEEFEKKIMRAVDKIK